MHQIILGLGSNIENRHNFLKQAIFLIEKQIGEVKQHSKIYETKAWGIENQENFLNLAIEVATPFFPLKVLEKIFHPFFTTKPSGQGTGLGLSLSYDIITKGHGGEIKVETKEGEGTTFTIHLPV